MAELLEQLKAVVMAVAMVEQWVVSLGAKLAGMMVGYLVDLRVADLAALMAEQTDHWMAAQMAVVKVD